MWRREQGGWDELEGTPYNLVLKFDMGHILGIFEQLKPMFGFDLDEKDACKVPLSQELSNQYIRKICDKKTKSEAWFLTELNRVFNWFGKRDVYL